MELERTPPKAADRHQKYWKNIMKRRYALNDDWFIAEDPAGALHICDMEEGDPLFAIPNSMTPEEGFAFSEEMTLILIDVADLLWIERRKAGNNGIKTGRAQAQREFHDMLGIGLIVEALKEERT